MYNLELWRRNPWSIFDELESMQAGMNRAFEDAGYGRGRSSSSYPPMNAWSSGEGVVIDAELPGVDPKDVDISVVGDELTLTGKVNEQEPPKGEVFIRRERPRGSFSRTLKLPFRANADAVKATFTNGVLRLTVPRAAEEKPRKITVETD